MKSRKHHAEFREHSSASIGSTGFSAAQRWPSARQLAALRGMAAFDVLAGLPFLAELATSLCGRDRLQQRLGSMEPAESLSFRASCKQKRKTDHLDIVPAQTWIYTHIVCEWSGNHHIYMHISPQKSTYAHQTMTSTLGHVHTVCQSFDIALMLRKMMSIRYEFVHKP